MRGEVGLDEFVAGLRHVTAGQEDGGVTGIAGVGVAMAADAVAQQGVHREAFAGTFDRRGGDVGEAHRAVPFECGDPRVGRRGHHGSEHAVGDAAGSLE